MLYHTSFTVYIQKKMWNSDLKSFCGMGVLTFKKCEWFSRPRSPHSEPVKIILVIIRKDFSFTELNGAGLILQAIHWNMRCLLTYSIILFKGSASNSVKWVFKKKRNLLQLCKPLGGSLRTEYEEPDRWTDPHAFCVACNCIFQLRESIHPLVFSRNCILVQVSSRESDAACNHSPWLRALLRLASVAAVHTTLHPPVNAPCQS